MYPSNTNLSFNVWNYDKIGHFIMFFGWTFLYGVYRAIKKKNTPNLWIVFGLGSFYGLLIEFLQFIVPTNRSPELMDFIADMLGSAVATLVLHFLFKLYTKNSTD